MELITPTTILSTAILISIGIIGYFLQDKLKNLAETDDRLEKKVDKVSEKVGSIESRVSRIEGSMRLAPISAASPLRLTPVGEDILEKSGIGAATRQFKNELIADIKKKNPQTAYDVQEMTKKIFQDFKWGEENLKKFKDYSFQSGKWTLADIYEVGAIYFRDIALQELGMSVADLDKSNQKPPAGS